jgi:hypothetical protein
LKRSFYFYAFWYYGTLILVAHFDIQEEWNRIYMDICNLKCVFVCIHVIIMKALILYLFIAQGRIGYISWIISNCPKFLDINILPITIKLWKGWDPFLNVSNALHGTSRISFNNDFQGQTHLKYTFMQFWIQFYIVIGLCVCNCHVATLSLDKTYNPCSISQFKWVQTLMFLMFHKVLI